VRHTTGVVSFPASRDPLATSGYLDVIVAQLSSGAQNKSFHASIFFACAWRGETSAGQTYRIHLSLTSSPRIEDNVSIVARPRRLEFPGALYHLAAGGNARKAVFQGHADHERLLERLNSQLNALKKGRVMR